MRLEHRHREAQRVLRSRLARLGVRRPLRAEAQHVFLKHTERIHKRRELLRGERGGERRDRQRAPLQVRDKRRYQRLQSLKHILVFEEPFIREPTDVETHLVVGAAGGAAATRPRSADATWLAGRAQEVVYGEHDDGR